MAAGKEYNFGEFLKRLTARRFSGSLPEIEHSPAGKNGVATYTITYKRPGGDSDVDGSLSHERFMWDLENMLPHAGVFNCSVPNILQESFPEKHKDAKILLEMKMRMPGAHPLFSELDDNYPTQRLGINICGKEHELAGDMDPYASSVFQADSGGHAGSVLRRKAPPANPAAKSRVAQEYASLNPSESVDFVKASFTRLMAKELPGRKVSIVSWAPEGQGISCFGISWDRPKIDPDADDSLARDNVSDKLMQLLPNAFVVPMPNPDLPDPRTYFPEEFSEQLSKAEEKKADIHRIGIVVEGRADLLVHDLLLNVPELFAGSNPRQRRHSPNHQH